MKLFLSEFYKKITIIDRNRKLKHSHKFPIFTISIGNFQIGGTGKTPIICSIVESFQDCVVVSRGYKRQKSVSKTFFTKSDSVFTVGDEAKLVMDRYDNRFLIGKERVGNAKKYLELGNSPSMFILDDGFQHYKFQRDLDIVVVDLSKYSFTDFYNNTLPLVYSREPVSSLERSDAIIFSKDDNTALSIENRELLLKSFPTKKFFDSYSDLKYPQNIYGDYLQSTSVILISGIANNESFYNSVSLFSIEISNHFKFDDHHNYSKNDIDKIRLFINKGKIIVTTEKDFVKLKELLPEYYLHFLFFTKYDIVVPNLIEYISLLYNNYRNNTF